MKQRKPHHAWAVAVVLLTSSVAACTNQAHETETVSEDSADMSACADYVTAFRTCLSHLSPTGGADVERRVTQMQASFALGAEDPKRRAEMRATCTAGLQRLKTSCP